MLRILHDTYLSFDGYVVWLSSSSVSLTHPMIFKKSLLISATISRTFHRPTVLSMRFLDAHETWDAILGLGELRMQ